MEAGVSPALSRNCNQMLDKSTGSQDACRAALFTPSRDKEDELAMDTDSQIITALDVLAANASVLIQHDRP